MSILTKDKVTEIFCIADDFCKELAKKEIQVRLVKSQQASAILGTKFEEKKLNPTFPFSKHSLCVSVFYHLWVVYCVLQSFIFLNYNTPLYLDRYSSKIR